MEKIYGRKNFAFNDQQSTNLNQIRLIRDSWLASFWHLKQVGPQWLLTLFICPRNPKWSIPSLHNSFHTLSQCMCSYDRICDVHYLEGSLILLLCLTICLFGVVKNSSSQSNQLSLNVTKIGWFIIRLQNLEHFCIHMQSKV